MIPLRIGAESSGGTAPFVVRLNTDFGLRSSAHDAYLQDIDGNHAVYSFGSGEQLRLHSQDPLSLDGDVLLVLPTRRVAHRLIRASSPDNTLVVTEQCDQLCVMCSQPPKPVHVHHFALLETAAMLAPAGSVIGISGGEPTLYKQALFDFLRHTLAGRPDLSFHILSNAQHFEESDLPILRQLPASQITWGIPLYAPDPSLHDRIVGKAGAFDRLMSNLTILCKSGASIELRTVVMRANTDALPMLANQICTHIPFVARWAIMQLENIGFARKIWADQFYDSSADFAPIGAALDLARARGIAALLYNFPLCTLPPAYRKLAPPTISDWKRRYLECCNQCASQTICSGFFEWYPDDQGFAGIKPL